MLPRVIVLSLLPLALMVLLAAGFGYFYWDATVAWTREALEAWPLLASLQRVAVGDGHRSTRSRSRRCCPW